MTIDRLNAITTLTAGDELPVWDVESSLEEPTKKITASNLAASVKSLADLPNTTEMNAAIAQSTASAVNMSFEANYIRVNDPSTGMVIGVNPITNLLFVKNTGGTITYYRLTPM